MHAPIEAGLSRTMTRAQRNASLTAAISAIAVVGVGISLSIPLLALEMEARGISRVWMGVNTALGGVATIAIAPFVPLLVRKIGVRTLLVLAILVAAATLPAFKVTSFPLWFPLRFALGAALCILFAVSEFWINAVAPPHRRGLIMGIYATALSVGAATGPSILSLLGASGWPPYVAGVVVLGLGALPILFAGDTAPKIEGGSSHGVLGFLKRSPTALLASLVFGAIETAVMNFMPLYGVTLGLSASSAALLLTTAVAGNIVFQIPLGLISDKADRRVLLFLCALMGAIGAFTLPFISVDSMWFLVMVFLATGIVGSLYTVGLSYLGARFHGADLAAANAAFVMLYSFGLIGGPPLAGWAMDLYNPYGFAFAVSAMLAAYAAVAGAGLLVPRRGRA